MSPSVARLLAWYRMYKRELPWRQSSDPYHIWISEVMSQQTTLVVVLARFVAFVQELPSVQSLFACSDHTLRRLWTGLGYYARARNLKKGAEHIVKQRNGSFPTTFEEWKSVPGCGDYTAAMLASICLGERVAAVDGNVTRVAARVLGMGSETWQGDGKTRIRNFAQSFVDAADSPGDCNQALIELGALVCRKHNPTCVECPLGDVCQAFLQKRVHECPPPKPRRAAEECEVFPVVFRKDGRIAFFLRGEGFLRATRGFPLFRNSLFLSTLSASAQFAKGRGFAHVITHHKLGVKPFLCDVEPRGWNRAQELLRECGVADVVWLDESEVDSAIQTSLDAKTWRIVKLLT